jgi:hypothetical protein
MSWDVDLGPIFESFLLVLTFNSECSECGVVKR